jgi:hypothetical protein
MMKNLFAQHSLWHMIFSITKDFVFLTITFEVKALKSLCHLGLTSWLEKWPWDG